MFYGNGFNTFAVMIYDFRANRHTIYARRQKIVLSINVNVIITLETKNSSSQRSPFSIKTWIPLSPTDRMSWNGF